MHCELFCHSSCSTTRNFRVYEVVESSDANIDPTHPIGVLWMTNLETEVGPIHCYLAEKYLWRVIEQCRARKVHCCSSCVVQRKAARSHSYYLTRVNAPTTYTRSILPTWLIPVHTMNHHVKHSFECTVVYLDFYRYMHILQHLRWENRPVLHLAYGHFPLKGVVNEYNNLKQGLLHWDRPFSICHLQFGCHSIA